MGKFFKFYTEQGVQEIWPDFRAITIYCNIGRNFLNTLYMFSQHINTNYLFVELKLRQKRKAVGATRSLSINPSCCNTCTTPNGTKIKNN